MGVLKSGFLFLFFAVSLYPVFVLLLTNPWLQRQCVHFFHSLLSNFSSISSVSSLLALLLEHYPIHNTMPNLRFYQRPICPQDSLWLLARCQQARILWLRRASSDALQHQYPRRRNTIRMARPASTNCFCTQRSSHYCRPSRSNPAS